LDVHLSQLKPFLDDELEGRGIHLFFHRDGHPQALPLQVETVRAHRLGPRGLEFLVHWKGGGNQQDSWEESGTFIIHRSGVWAEYCREKALLPGVNWEAAGEGVMGRAE
jgi:hypothetical protein